MLIVLVIVVGAVAFLVTNYAWLFAKTIQGQIVEIEKTIRPDVVVHGDTQRNAENYAILIQDDKGKMFTATATDTQWGVAKKGYCVIATLQRYPPWDVENGGTFYNARLRQVYRCSQTKGEEAAPAPVPAETPSEGNAPAEPASAE
jgi:hypothetical protein